MLDALKSLHRLNRNEELAQYGKSINYSHIVRNRAKYTRKNKHKNNFNFFD